MFLTLIASEHVWMGEGKSNEETILLRKTKLRRGLTEYDSFVRAEVLKIWLKHL